MKKVSVEIYSARRRFRSMTEHSIYSFLQTLLGGNLAQRSTLNAIMVALQSHQVSRPFTRSMDGGRLPTVLFSGPLAAGKWTREEEQFTLQLIINFMEGRCPDCEKGESSVSGGVVLIIKS